MGRSGSFLREFPMGVTLQRGFYPLPMLFFPTLGNLISLGGAIKPVNIYLENYIYLY